MVVRESGASMGGRRVRAHERDGAANSYIHVEHSRPPSTRDGLNWTTPDQCEVLTGVYSNAAAWSVGRRLLACRRWDSYEPSRDDYIIHETSRVLT